MSRAFVKETSESAPPPERMVDEGPNLVTPEGLAQIEAHLARIEASQCDLYLEPVDLPELLQNIVDIMQVLAEMEGRINSQGQS